MIAIQDPLIDRSKMLERYDPNLILDYIEGDLSPAERAGFEQLLVQDRQLQVLVDELLEDRRALRQMPLEKAPLEVLDRVQQRMERNMLLDAVPRHAEDMAVVRRFRMGRLVAYGSLAAMVLFSALMMYRTLAPWNDMPAITNGSNGLATADSDRAEQDRLAMAQPEGSVALAERPGTLTPSEPLALRRDAAGATPEADESLAMARGEGAGGGEPAVDVGEAERETPAAAVALAPSAPPVIPDDEPFYAVLGPPASSWNDASRVAMAEPTEPFAARSGPETQRERQSDHEYAMLTPGAMESAQSVNRHVVFQTPTQQLEVVTADPVTVQATLADWCVANGAIYYAAVPPTHAGAGNADDQSDQPPVPATIATQAFQQAAGDKPDDQEAAESLVIVVRNEQLSQLISHLETATISRNEVVVKAAGEDSTRWASLEPAARVAQTTSKRGAAEPEADPRPLWDQPAPMRSRASSLPDFRREQPEAREQAKDDSADQGAGLLADLAVQENAKPGEPSTEPVSESMIGANAPMGDAVDLFAEWRSLAPTMTLNRSWGTLLLPQLPLGEAIPLAGDAGQTLSVIVQIRRPTPEPVAEPIEPPAVEPEPAPAETKPTNDKADADAKTDAPASDKP